MTPDSVASSPGSENHAESANGTATPAAAKTSVTQGATEHNLTAGLSLRLLLDKVVTLDDGYILSGNLEDTDPRFGGALDAVKDAVAVLRDVRSKATLTTRVMGGAVCASGCVALFMQGERLLGDGGRVLIPLSSTEVSSPSAMPAGADSMVFWMERIVWGDVRMFGARVDAAGDMLWGGQPVVVSSSPSEKSDLQLAPGASGAALLVWDDNRNAAVTGKDIYGQKVRADGALGN